MFKYFLLTAFLCTPIMFLDNGWLLTKQVWAGPLSKHRLVVALWNRCSKAATITAKWEVLGLDTKIRMSIRDLWQVIYH